MTLQQQQAQAVAAAAAFQSQFYPPYQAQTIYSGAPGPIPPMYPAAATLRGQQHQQYGGGVATGQQVPRTYQSQKKPTKAVAIVDANTKETLDVEKIKSGGAKANVATPTSASGSQTDVTKRTIFREQMLEIQSSDPVKPNAIIKEAGDSTGETPKQEIHTRQIKPVKITDPVPPTKPVTITDPPVSDKPVTTSDSKPVKQVIAPEPEKPVEPVVIDVKSEVSVISVETPPTSSGSASEVPVKEETGSEFEHKMDKLEEAKPDEVLPPSDRSSTGLKSDSNTGKYVCTCIYCNFCGPKYLLILRKCKILIFKLLCLQN